MRFGENRIKLIPQRPVFIKGPFVEFDTNGFPRQVTQQNVHSSIRATHIQKQGISRHKKTLTDHRLEAGEDFGKAA